jgi:tRNA G18 (ribose-2'-O)-methylase SpoU
LIAEGRLVVRRLTESRHRMISVLVQQGREHLVPASTDAEIPIYTAPTVVLRSLVGFHFHRGILACAERPPLLSIERLTPSALTASDSCGSLATARRSVALALFGINCPENLGSILRSAAAFGISDILIGPGTVDHLSRRVIRVSMASALVHRFYDLSDPVSQLPPMRDQDGYRLVATTLESDAMMMNCWDRSHPKWVLMFGNEADGLDREIEQLACDRVTIPMRGGTDSLNVSVAAAIFMHELTR